MAGIAGMACLNSCDVEKILQKLNHRGSSEHWMIREFENCTLGATWPPSQTPIRNELSHSTIVRDQVGAGRLASAKFTEGKLILDRDGLGLAPLYWGKTSDGVLCFASEVKALLEVTRQI